MTSFLRKICYSRHLFLFGGIVRAHPQVTVGSAHAEATANVRITQIVEVVGERERDAKLIALLNKHHSSRKNRVLVFGLYKKVSASKFGAKACGFELRTM